MLENVQVLCHSSIKITGEKTIYIDPYEIKEESHDADIIFCTHAHYDHFSPVDIQKVRKEDTYMVTVDDNMTEVLKMGFAMNHIAVVEPNYKFNVDGISFITTPAYNKEKAYHPKSSSWVGYLIEMNGIRYYIAGDTDFIEELENIQCDVAFLPVGGTYTMDAYEASKMANTLMPKAAVPVHYGTIVGSYKDAEKFLAMLNMDIEGKILIP